MFESKKCKNCGGKIKGEWEFCPYCGEETKEPEDFFEGNIFGDMINMIDDEFKRIDKSSVDLFKIPKVDMRMPKTSNGINIIITSGTGMRPKIEVKTSGNFKRLEPEIKRNLGVKSIEEVEEKPVRKISRVTEEPETEIKTSGNKQIIQIKLPEIKSFKDIDVKKLEQSLEVKAFAKDKTYFKLIPVPSNSEIVNKDFRGNVLRIELTK